MPERDQPGGNQDSQQDRGDKRHRLRRQQELALVNSVGDDAGDRRKQKSRQRPPGSEKASYNFV